MRFLITPFITLFTLLAVASLPCSIEEEEREISSVTAEVTAVTENSIELTCFDSYDGNVYEVETNKSLKKGNKVIVWFDTNHTLEVTDDIIIEMKGE